MPDRKSKSIIVTKSRTVHTYSELWHASRCVLDAGLETSKGRSWQFLSSAILTAFAFEAYLNHIGPKLFSSWAQLERVSPLGKFDLICEKLNLAFAANSRPRCTLNELANFRNTLAHGKTETVRPEAKELDARADIDKHLGERPLTNWEMKVHNSEFAERARADVCQVLEAIHERIPEPKEKLFRFGIGEASAVAS